MPSAAETPAVRLAVRVAVHRGAHGQLGNARGTWHERQACVVELADDRSSAFGEATPLPGHSPEDWVEARRDLLALGPTLWTSPPPALPSSGTPTDGAGTKAIAAWLAAQSRSLETPSARFALETALVDYWSQQLAVPAWRLLGGAHPVEVPVSRVLDVLDEGLEGQVERALAEGVHTIKLKLGRDFARELAALVALRRRWPAATLGLRLDVNQSWPADEVLPRLERLAPLAPELVEEPCLGFDGARTYPVPIARDESLVGVEPTVPWLRAQPAVRFLVLKPMLLGGLSRCLQWAEVARLAGRTAIVSHFFDGPLALAACAHLVCALGMSAPAAGLSAHPGLRAWRARSAPPSFVRLDRITPPTRSGLGASFTRRLSVLAAAEEVPGRAALVFDDREVGYVALARGVRRVARWLARTGVADVCRAESRPVCFVAEPRLGSFLLLYACIELGLPVLPLHPRATPRERSRSTQELNPAFEAEDDHLTRFEAWLGGPEPLPAERQEVDSGLPAELGTTELGTAEPKGDEFERDDLEEPDPEGDLAWLMTSGSTGQPRAVRLSRRAFLASADASSLRLGWQEGDRWLLALPFAHVGGLSVLTRCLIARRTVVVGTPRVNAAWVARLARHGVTLLSLVPAQLAHLLASPELTLPRSVRAVLVGGARAPVELIAAARARGVPALRTYGLTEACSQVATESLIENDTPRGDGYVGHVLPSFEVRVTASGRIQLRGEPLCSGYVGSDCPLLPGGWFETSDRGELDGAQLRVFGRSDNLLVSGGENVSPEGVEARLTTHPGVVEACVVGVPDPTWGQRIAALLVLRGDTTIPQITAWVDEHFGAHQRPRSLFSVDALPLLPSGKVDRAAAAGLVASLDSFPADAAKSTL